MNKNVEKYYLEEFDEYKDAIMLIDYQIESGTRACVACLIAFIVYLSLYAVCGWTWIRASLTTNILIDVGISISACPIGFFIDHMFLSFKKRRLEVAYSMAQKRYWEEIYR